MIKPGETGAFQPEPPGKFPAEPEKRPELPVPG